MKKNLFFSLLNWLVPGQAQNVGIATSTPAEKLDVKGNVNISRGINPNGVSGKAGQVLATNSQGSLQCSGGDGASYKNL